MMLTILNMYAPDDRASNCERKNWQNCKQKQIIAQSERLQYLSEMDRLS